MNALLDDLFLQVLGRRPLDSERATFSSALSDGFAERLAPVEPGSIPKRATLPRAVSWSNHLNPEATRVKLELEREAREGDPATPRLRKEWREKMEDAVWALVVSPEFAFIP